MNTTVFARAEEFIWQNARVLERQLFAYHFKSGSRAAVLAALAAYQNADGGFGNALEPDIRCPDSQPVPTQHALEFLDEVGVEPVVVQRICDYLLTITTAEGGVPWLLPSALRYSRAPWWQTGENPPAALNPTAAIVGLLYKHGVQHEWLAPATAYCWSKIADLQPTEIHDMGVAFTFLAHAPDRQRAAQELDRLVNALLASGLVADAQATGYVRRPLDWAPTPEHPLRAYFSPAQLAANLDAVLAEQGADGGWTIPWPPLSPGCELEWRGWVTLSTLRRLQANGRLPI